MGHWKVRRATASEASWRLDLVIHFATVIMLTAAVANIFGLVSLARLLSNGLLGGAYAGGILYGTLKVVEGLLAVILQLRPLSLLRTVHLHRPVVQRRLMRGFGVAALLGWLFIVLDLPFHVVVHVS